MSANNSFNESIASNSAQYSSSIESKRIEILSIRIEYDRNLPYTSNITYPFGFFQLNHSLDGNAITWYSQNIRSDVTEDIDDVTFILPHRYIISGDDDVFHFNGQYFNNIDLVFGQEKTYWRFSTKLETGETYVKRGEIVLEVGNCPCCIDDHFKRIVSVLKNKYKMK